MKRELEDMSKEDVGRGVASSKPKRGRPKKSKIVADAPLRYTGEVIDPSLPVAVAERVITPRIPLRPLSEREIWQRLEAQSGGRQRTEIEPTIVHSARSARGMKPKPVKEPPKRLKTKPKAVRTPVKLKLKR